MAYLLELRHSLLVQRQMLRTGHVPENCAKLVHGAYPTGPRIFVRKMCGSIRKCAEIVRNVCGRASAQFAQNIGVGLPRTCMHKCRATFR